MRTILKKLFIDNWLRKLIALVLAMFIWIVINHSISTTKTLHNVPVKVTNLHKGKTVEGLKSNNILNKGISLSLRGNKHTLDAISAEDLLVIIDVQRKKTDWIAKITPKNLLCLNPSIDITKNISSITHPNLIIKPTNLITEKIPILVTRPIGEAPNGYHFIDVYPYHLSTSVTGPENVIKTLKQKKLKLTFNLNKVTGEMLDELYDENKKNTLSYLVPDDWKNLNLPYISSDPIKINDKRADGLRIDFVRTESIPLKRQLPLTLFFPSQYRSSLNPKSFSLTPNEFISKQNGMLFLKTNLYAKGVSPLFVDIVKDMIQVVVIVTPCINEQKPLWNVQFIYPVELENRYVAQASANSIEGSSEISPHLREEYLRNRFRHYMNRFRLYTEDDEKLSLNINIEADKIDVRPELP